MGFIHGVKYEYSRTSADSLFPNILRQQSVGVVTSPPEHLGFPVNPIIEEGFDEDGPLGIALSEFFHGTSTGILNFHLM